MVTIRKSEFLTKQVSVIFALWATVSILAMVLRASHAVLRTVYATSLLRCPFA